MSNPTAVLLLAHGTPNTIEEIPEYLRNVTHGRPLPESVVTEIRRRYSLIGPSPLTRLTREQGQRLSGALNLPVYVAMRNWKPFIADVIQKMRADGVQQFAVLCLAPQNSRTSVGLYRRAVFAQSGDMRVDFTETWADHPRLAEAFAERLRAAWTPGTPVIFTAHSVPCATLQSDANTPADPYADECRRTATMVADRVGIPESERRFAFQSQGASGGKWIGPTVEETLTALHERKIRRVLVQPVGFLCDHVEILYDIDIAFRQFAANLGIELQRTESLNDSPLLIEALADLARQALSRLGS